MVQLLPVCSTWKSLMTKPLGMAPLVFRVTVKKGLTLTQTAFLSKWLSTETQAGISIEAYYAFRCRYE